MTTSVYDMGDRRTEVNHPASGITTFTYDALGNVLTKQTANLAKEGKSITYDYDYHRLTGINYPDHPENNVKYYYGGRNASQNRIGRLMLREDGTGAIEYFYGNLVYVNTGRIKQDGMLDSTAAERKLRWDEENRLTASDDNGFVTNYWYDADGERTVKTSGEGEQLYVNSEFAGGRTNTAKFSLYVSPYLVANQGGRYTKHIYIGSQRIVSKIGDFASYGSDPRRIQYAGSETDGLSVNYKQKYSAQQQVIKDNYAIFEVPYNGTDNNDYVDGQGFCCDDGSPEAAQARALALENNFQDPDAYEKLQFYYHPDHLGSSSYITNLDGEVVQHIEYVPFGEVFIEERNSIWNTPYLFNAKEFDEETGLYYYGARYYDPRLSLWISTDPFIVTNKFYSDNIKENINGGVYNPFNLNAYTQCWQNPIRYKDDDGNAITPETAWDIINVVMGATSFAGNVVSGNVLGAVLDGIGLIYDGAATAIPVLPAGASSALGTYRFARATNKVIGAINKLGDLRPFKNSQKMQNLLGKANNAISDHLNPEFKQTMQQCRIHC